MVAGWDLYDTVLVHMFAGKICIIRLLHILQRQIWDLGELARDVSDVQKGFSLNDHPPLTRTFPQLLFQLYAFLSAGSFQRKDHYYYYAESVQMGSPLLLQAPRLV